MKIIQSPDFRTRMQEIGAEPIGDTPEQTAQQIRIDTEKFARLVKEAKVTIEQHWGRVRTRTEVRSTMGRPGHPIERHA